MLEKQGSVVWIAFNYLQKTKKQHTKNEKPLFDKGQQLRNRANFLSFHKLNNILHNKYVCIAKAAIFYETGGVAASIC